MKKVQTDDGSFTFYSEEFQEHYHTKSGAIEEAELKHVGPAKDYFKKSTTILDFCFGLGYNSIVAMHYAATQNIFLKVIAIENDLEIIKQLETLEIPEIYLPYKNIILKMLDSENYSYEIPRCSIKLLLGDARDTLKQIKNGVDVVFYDPFSPTRCPELWTEEVFKKVYSIMSEKSILTTYSCARKVRDAMKNVGFEVQNGPIVGRRSPSTLALKN